MGCSRPPASVGRSTTTASRKSPIANNDNAGDESKLDSMAATPKEVPRPFSNVTPRSSIDNLLRTAQQHHVQLSFMADTKASILITISSIVLTIALSRAGDPHLRPALLTLASACLISRSEERRVGKE